MMYVLVVYSVLECAQHFCIPDSFFTCNTNDHDLNICIVGLE